MRKIHITVIRAPTTPLRTPSVLSERGAFNIHMWRKEIDIYICVYACMGIYICTITDLFVRMFIFEFKFNFSCIASSNIHVEALCLYTHTHTHGTSLRGIDLIMPQCLRRA